MTDVLCRQLPVDAARAGTAGARVLPAVPVLAHDAAALRHQPALSCRVGDAREPHAGRAGAQKACGFRGALASRVPPAAAWLPVHLLQ